MYKLVSEGPRIKKQLQGKAGQYKRVVVVARGFFLWMIKLFLGGKGVGVVSHPAWAGLRQSTVWVSLGGT